MKDRERKARRLLNVCKYELVTDQGAKVTGRRWLAPRGKALSGTLKQLARLTWDRKRFA